MHNKSTMGGTNTCELALKFGTIVKSCYVQNTEHGDYIFHEEIYSGRQGSVRYFPEYDVFAKAANGYQDVAQVGGREVIHW